MRGLISVLLVFGKSSLYKMLETSPHMTTGSWLLDLVSTYSCYTGHTQVRTGERCLKYESYMFGLICIINQKRTCYKRSWEGGFLLYQPWVMIVDCNLYWYLWPWCQVLLCVADSGFELDVLALIPGWHFSILYGRHWIEVKSWKWGCTYAIDIQTMHRVDNTGIVDAVFTAQLWFMSLHQQSSIVFPLPRSLFQKARSQGGVIPSPPSMCVQVEHTPLHSEVRQNASITWESQLMITRS